MKTDNQYQPKTGARCSCRPGIQRDNCPSCEGTGQVIDFAAIRARKSEPEPETLTMAGFAKRESITMTAVHGSNPHMQDQDMDHWKCTLRIESPAGVRKMVVPFSMGRGHKGKQPTVEEVLNCIASDSTVKDMSYRDFCAEFGYDEHENKSGRLFNACQKTAKDLQKFIGQDRGSVFEELVYEVERL